MQKPWGIGGRGHRGGVALLALLVALLVGAPRRASAAAADFPTPPGLETQVAFWKRVFAEYSENQVVIHDNLYLDKVYEVVDLRPLAASGADDQTVRKMRRIREEDAKERIGAILGRLDRSAPDPASLSQDERAVYELWKDVDSPRKYRDARERLRGQLGLRERFAAGVAISRKYLPHMEQIFRDEGLPVELTRLPFVESTFNVRAYSKVGAAGIWQFIPSTAKIYLRLNSIEDSRRDPLYATIGAARHLRDDFEALGSWPLAVTAYNHGRAGIARAVAETGSADLVDIIRRYRGKSFGFASRNFYAEFVAALEVERDWKRHFGELDLEKKLEFQEVRVKHFVKFSTLARLAGVSVSELHDLNPGYAPEVVEGKLYVPKGYAVRVPKGRADAFGHAYAKLPASERHASQRRQYLVHKVKRGQNLGAIARRYKTTVKAITVANGLRSPRSIRAGQVLKIPAG